MGVARCGEGDAPGTGDAPADHMGAGTPIRRTKRADQQLAVEPQLGAGTEQRKAQIHVVENGLRPGLAAAIGHGIDQPERAAADRCLDPPAQPPVLAVRCRLDDLRLGEEMRLLALPAFAASGEPGRGEGQAAMQRPAVLGLADVVEPAGHEQAREAAQEPLTVLGLAVMQTRMAKAGRRLPGTSHAAPAQGRDIQRAAFEQREGEPAARIEGDGAARPARDRRRG